MKAIEKDDFVLWIYYLAGQPIDGPVRNALAYLMETKLRTHGFTSGYKFNDWYGGGATDHKFENDAQILAAALLLCGETRTPNRLTEFGDKTFKLVISQRLKSTLGERYKDMEKYGQQIILANSRIGVVQKAIYTLEVEPNLEEIVIAG